MTITKFLLDEVWPRHFASVRFANLNKFLVQLGLRGLGVLNWRTAKESGEEWLVSTFLRQRFAGRNRPVIVDVGAHFGESAAGFRQVFRDARIVAAEPSPTAFALAKERLATLNVEIHQTALSDAAGSVDLFDYEAKSVGSQHASIFEDVFRVGKKDAKWVPVKVVATTLDLLCAKYQIERVDFLKIDTEGCEFKVLKGAAGLLARGAVDVIQFEFNEMNVFSRVFMSDFVGLLPGYALYRLLPNGLLPLNPHWHLGANFFAFQNIVALRQSDESSKR